MANERLNHDATFSGFVPTMIYCGADTSLIDNVYCPTGFYNIEQAPEGHRLPDGNPYYRVIVLGDHRQTPTGYATEIAIGYQSGRLWSPYIRASNPAGWTEWTKLTEILRRRSDMANERINLLNPNAGVLSVTDKVTVMKNFHL